MAVCPDASVVHVTTCLSTLQDATREINGVSSPLMGFFHQQNPNHRALPCNSPSNRVAALAFQLKRDNCSIKESSQDLPRDVLELAGSGPKHA